MKAATQNAKRGTRLPQRYGVVPGNEEETPLRVTLVEMKPERRLDLHAYFARQGQLVRAWLNTRHALYWTAHEYPQDMAETEELHNKIAATCALDLLVWQSGCANAKEAQAWFSGVKAMAEEGEKWAEAGKQEAGIRRQETVEKEKAI